MILRYGAFHIGVFVVVLTIFGRYGWAQISSNDEGKHDSTNAMQVEELPAVQVGKNLPDSIMYDYGAARLVNKAVRAWRDGIPAAIAFPEFFSDSQDVRVEKLQEIIDQTTFTEEENTPRILPSDIPVFYLQSVMYFSSQDWTIWLNDSKITEYGDAEAVTVVDVVPGKVFFLWKGANLDGFSPGWKQRFSAAKDARFLTNWHNIMIDTLTQNVAFVLYPNQLLQAASMKIIDGGDSIQENEKEPFSGLFEDALNSTVQQNVIAPPHGELQESTELKKLHYFLQHTHLY